MDRVGAGRGGLGAGPVPAADQRRHAPPALVGRARAGGAPALPRVGACTESPACLDSHRALRPGKRRHHPGSFRSGAAPRAGDLPIANPRRRLAPPGRHLLDALRPRAPLPDRLEFPLPSRYQTPLAGRARGPLRLLPILGDRLRHSPAGAAVGVRPDRLPHGGRLPASRGDFARRAAYPVSRTGTGPRPAARTGTRGPP